MSTPSTTSSSRETASQSRLTLPAVLLALATVVTAVSSLMLALPSLATATRASATQLTWIVDAYALTFAALLLPGGALGDRIGRRRVLVGGLIVFGLAASSVLAIDDAAALIAVRAVLGAAAAVIMPATLATITATFPAADRVKAVAAWAGVAGASAVLGLFLAGLALKFWEWQAVFLTSTGLAVVALGLVLKGVPESAEPEAASKDAVGELLSVMGLAVLVYSIIEAPTHGWASGRTVAGLLTGVVVLAVFMSWESRARQPLLAPRYFRLRPFSAGSLSLTTQFFCFFGMLFLLMQYLQLVRGYEPLTAACAMIPLPLGLMPAARFSPRLAARLGQRWQCALGLILLAAATAWLAQVDDATPYWQFAAGLWPAGVGMGLAMPPATSAVTDALPVAEQGVASAMNDLTRELGGAIGIALMASVSTSAYRDGLDLTRVPPPLREAVEASAPIAMHLPEPIAGMARTSFCDGLSHAFLLGSAMLTVVAVLVVVLLARPSGR